MNATRWLPYGGWECTDTACGEGHPEEIATCDTCGAVRPEAPPMTVRAALNRLGYLRGADELCARIQHLRGTDPVCTLRDFSVWLDGYFMHRRPPQYTDGQRSALRVAVLGVAGNDLVRFT